MESQGGGGRGNASARGGNAGGRGQGRGGASHRNKRHRKRSKAAALTAGNTAGKQLHQVPNSTNPSNHHSTTTGSSTTSLPIGKSKDNVVVADGGAKAVVVPVAGTAVPLSMTTNTINASVMKKIKGSVAKKTIGGLNNSRNNKKLKTQKHFLPSQTPVPTVKESDQQRDQAPKQNQMRTMASVGRSAPLAKPSPNDQDQAATMKDAIESLNKTKSEPPQLIVETKPDTPPKEPISGVSLGKGVTTKEEACAQVKSTKESLVEKPTLPARSESMVDSETSVARNLMLDLEESSTVSVIEMKSKQPSRLVSGLTTKPQEEPPTKKQQMDQQTEAMSKPLAQEMTRHLVGVEQTVVSPATSKNNEQPLVSTSSATTLSKTIAKSPQISTSVDTALVSSSPETSEPSSKSSWGPSFGTPVGKKSGNKFPSALQSPLSSWFFSEGPANFIHRVEFPESRVKEQNLENNTETTNRLKNGASDVDSTSISSSSSPGLKRKRDCGVEGLRTKRCSASDEFFRRLAKAPWRTWYNEAQKVDLTQILDPPLPKALQRRFEAHDSNTKDMEVSSRTPTVTPTKRCVKRQSPLEALEQEIVEEKRRAREFEEQLLHAIQGRTLDGQDLTIKYAALLKE